MRRELKRVEMLLRIGLIALLLPWTSSAKAQGTLTIASNLVYASALAYNGSNVSLTLDAYYLNDTRTNRPVLILTHGGGFGGGDKGYTVAQGNFYPDIATAFATNGFVVFSINYRLWPGCSGGCTQEIDMAVEDVMTAVGWIRSHSAEYRADAAKVFIAGDSAGGGLAINASYRSTNAASFLGCISLWGGVPPYGNNVHPVNGCPISSQTPPTCLIHGTTDAVVPYAISQNLSSNLTATAVYNELHPLAGLDHYPVMANSSYNTNLVSTIVDYMIAFANRLKGNAGIKGAGPVRLGSQWLQAENSQFSFDIVGPTNAMIVVEQSTNLMNSWQAIVTNQLFVGVAWHTVAISPGSEFYRARILSP